MDQFVVQALQNTVFSVDAKITTHPINKDVNSPDELSKMSTYITYQKGRIYNNQKPCLLFCKTWQIKRKIDWSEFIGGSVIRMMSQILTEKVFQAGLQTYLDTKWVSANFLIRCEKWASINIENLAYQKLPEIVS